MISFLTRILPLLAVAALGLSACGSPTPPADQAVSESKAPKADPAAGVDKKDLLYLDLKHGRVTIRLRPDLAPNHVKRYKSLAAKGFYDGLKWHRVIAGFMAQTGDPTGTGAGGSKLPDLKAEFTNTPFKRGTLGAARTNNPDTANSQFFICFRRTSHLDGQYTVFGEVIDGMEHVDRIRRGRPGSGEVPDPSFVIKMRPATASDA